MSNIFGVLSQQIMKHINLNTRRPRDTLSQSYVSLNKHSACWIMDRHDKVELELKTKNLETNIEQSFRDKDLDISLLFCSK